MKELKFYFCKKCGNVAEMINPSGIVPVCCNEEMTLLKENTVDASNEKHVPAVTRNGKSVKVQIGSEKHVMEDAHHIQWILVQQGVHVQRVDLAPGEEPIAEFELKDSAAPIKVYEHCNLHGLWLTEA